jgi:hypothetical protein
MLHAEVPGVNQRYSKGIKGTTILLARVPVLGIQSNELLKLHSAPTKDIKCTSNQLSF